MQAAIKPLEFRTFDQLLDSVRIDLKSYQSNGDIETAELIKIAQQINYELGLRIYQWKETILDINHGRARLPADFHQLQLALVCHNYTHVQNAPWNGNVLLEEVCPQPGITTCPCQKILNPTASPITTTIVNGDTITVPYTFEPGTTNVCARSIADPNQQLTITTDSFCYNTNTNGVYTCGAPTNCNICNVSHVGPCPEVVINPYPLGKCRTLCDGNVNIRILQYCESEVRCFESFSRLYIVPHRQASGFNSPGQFRDDCNEGSIYNGFLETNGLDCTRVYIAYLGAMEDDEGNLLVVDHPQINMYYEIALKERVLENLWLNGEPDIQNRLKYVSDKKEEAKWNAISISNMPNFRDCVKTIQTIRANHDRQYWHPISRYYGYMGWGPMNVDIM